MKYRFSTLLSFLFVIIFSGISNAQGWGPGGFEPPASPIDMYVVVLGVIAMAIALYAIRVKKSKI